MNRQILAFSIWMLACAGCMTARGFCQPQKRAENVVTIESLSTSLADLARKVRPSVVQIRTVGFGTGGTGTAGFVTSQQGTGSGVIFDSDGFIVTNAHVVEGAKHIEVLLHETWQLDVDPGGPAQKRSFAAQMIGIDPEIDLAVIKIDRTGLVPLDLADSDSLRQGQIVLAFGNPMALEDSVTMGVISSVDRQLNPSDASVYIQTDAPINPGNSGGPLVDARGRLAGINTLILSQSGGSEGIGFAIPANAVRKIYTELKENGYVRHGHIGIRVLAVTPSLAAGLQLPRDWGVIVEDVEPEGPSAQAGLQPGDYITAVDGAAIMYPHQFMSAIDRHAIGDITKIDALRGSEKLEADVIVEVQPDDPSRFLELITDKSTPIPNLGIMAINIDETVLKMISELRKPAGVLVAALLAGVLPAEGGLTPGDLIISLNDKTVPNVDGLIGLLNNLKIGSPVVLQIQHDDQLRFIVLDLP
jgi:serine protease Do